MFRIEEGKYYRDRQGATQGPMSLIKDHEAINPTFIWHCKSAYNPDVWDAWTSNGMYKSNGDASPFDLKEEIIRIQDTLAWKEKNAVKEELDELLTKATQGMTKHKLLDLAKDATRDRGLNYGAPENNFKRIAEHWNTFLSNRYGSAELPLLTPEDVAIMMMLMKIARLEHQGNHLDSWVDVAGYAACGAEIALRPQEGAKDTGNADNPIKEYGSSRDWEVT